MKLTQFLAILLLVLNLPLAEGFADQICRACPFDCRGIGAGMHSCQDLQRSRGQCCVELNATGMEQLEEKDYENSQRYGNNRYEDSGAYDDRDGYNPGDCPAGFHVNDRKCTQDERRRGCRDMRSPSGQTCVGW